MNSRSVYARDNIRVVRKSNGAFLPGGWGDQAIFGYMFRVIVGLAAAIIPSIVTIIWGASNGWVMTHPMLVVFGALSALIVFLGEWLRLRVYEGRLDAKTAEKAEIDAQSIEIMFRVDIDKFDRYFYFHQRAFDLIVGLSGIVMLFPLLVIIGLMIKFDSRGPIFFTTRRVGRGGKHITLLKFRTMHMPASEPSDAGEREAMITRAGAFLRATSLDELPQLLNVIGGSMSVIGPRPLTLADFEVLKSKEDEESRIRINIKPGIFWVEAISDVNSIMFPNSMVEYFRSIAAIIHYIIRGR